MYTQTHRWRISTTPSIAGVRGGLSAAKETVQMATDVSWTEIVSPKLQRAGFGTY